MKLIKTISIFILIVVLFSCTPEKRFVYLQNKDQKANQSSSTGAKVAEYKIKPNDVLYIKIAPIDQSAAVFNLNASTSTMASSTSATSDMGIYLDSYNVNDSGYVTLPLLGKILTKDLTIEQFQMNVQKMVDVYLKSSLVIVKLINFNITVLGEVNKPGTFRIYDAHINILDALGLANDLTINGNRKEIMLIRHNVQDKIVYMDLTDVNILNSDYYYLLPGDIIYVKPNKAKYYATNPFPFATILSAATTLLLLLEFVKK